MCSPLWILLFLASSAIAGDFTSPGERGALRRVIPTGREGGQTIIGGEGGVDNLILQANLGRGPTTGGSVWIVMPQVPLTGATPTALDLVPTGVTLPSGGGLHASRVLATMTYQGNSNGLAAFVGTGLKPTIQNVSGTAVTLKSVVGFEAGMAVNANNATLTLNSGFTAGWVAVMGAPNFTVTGAPTGNTVDRVVGLNMAGGIGAAGWTATNWGSVHQVDPVNSGTITNLYVVDVDPLTQGASIAALHSSIAAAGGRWNLLFDSTGHSFSQGCVRIGDASATDCTDKLEVNGHIDAATASNGTLKVDEAAWASIQTLAGGL